MYQSHAFLAALLMMHPVSAAVLSDLQSCSGLNSTTHMDMAYESSLLGSGGLASGCEPVPQRWVNGAVFSYGAIDAEVHAQYPVNDYLGQIENDRDRSDVPSSSGSSGASLSVSEQLATTDPQAAIEWLNGLQSNPRPDGSTPSSSQIPEPATAVLVSLAMLLAMKRKR